MIHPTAKIHPTAIIEEGAMIGECVEVGAHTIIGAPVVIGNNTRIHQKCIIEGNTEIGSNNHIHANCFIGAHPQSTSNVDYDRCRLVIGNDNVLHPNIHIDVGINLTKIGDNNHIMMGSGIGHDSIVNDACVFFPKANLGGSCMVDDHVSLGAGCVVHQRTRIGKNSMVGASSMIRHDVIPYSMVKGNPSELIGPNVVGMKRRGFCKQDIRQAFEIFRLLTRQDLIMEEKKQIISKIGYIIVADILDFFQEESINGYQFKNVR